MLLLYVLVYTSVCSTGQLFLCVFLCACICTHIYICIHLYLYVFVCVLLPRWVQAGHVRVFRTYRSFPFICIFLCHFNIHVTFIPFYGYSICHFTYLLWLVVLFSSFELSQGIGVKIFVAISLCLSMITSSGKKKKEIKKEMMC